MKTFWINFQLIRFFFTIYFQIFSIIKNRKPVKLKLINLLKWYSMNFKILNWFKIVSTQFYMNKCLKYIRELLYHIYTVLKSFQWFYRHFWKNLRLYSVRGGKAICYDSIEVHWKALLYICPAPQNSTWKYF